MNEYLWKSHSADETMSFGRRLAQFLAPGDVLVLTGDLGAGKTQLTKGIAAGLGISDDVTSPTFTIEMVYRSGRLPLYHFDLYRLDEAAQLEDTGLFDVLDADGVCVIEWGERFVDDIGESRLDIYLNRLDAEAGEGEEPPRSICLIPRCPRAIEIASGM
ncbi:MAG: tRNA (adenosine(37)-N6)-threonylcarbamoyltransferase complex ATPase subunit type 1 TsaE [Atopobium sp.]|jgi:tRNA threonylcarbamoyladenosine biosynthesis protein TsaE|nr:tRNA (adenosine(37)-N6)-threonylcarbamoyltransferase complex ATPase subunit type 1 TsaE [Atopobium sp.]